MNKIHGFRGMSSSEASKVKLKGHSYEESIAPYLDLNPKNPKELIPGHDKADFKLKNGKTISLKAGKARTQFALYGKNSSKFLDHDKFLKDKKNSSSTLNKEIYDIFNVFPENFEDYHSNKSFYKEKLKPKMISLSNFLQKKDNFKVFLNFFLFYDSSLNSYVDYLLHKNPQNSIEYYFFKREDVVNCFLKHSKVVNSKARSSTQWDDQKVILKGSPSNDNRFYNLLDVEIRKESNTHYNEILLVGSIKKYLPFLIKNIEQQHSILANDINFNIHCSIFDLPFK